MKKNILTAPFIREMCEATANMYRLGWDERNGGNITVGDDSREAYVFPADATIEGVEDVGYIVATIGDAGFETLEAAIKAAQDKVADLKAEVKASVDANKEDLAKLRITWFAFAIFSASLRCA